MHNAPKQAPSAAGASCFTMDFRKYSIGPTGLQDVPIWTDRLAACDLRDCFISNIKASYSNLSADEADLRQAIELLTVFWALSVMKIGHAQSVVDSCKRRGLRFSAAVRYPVLNALAEEVMPPDDAYVRQLSTGPETCPFWRWPLRLARQAVSPRVIRPMPAFLISLEEDIVVTTVTPAMERCATKSKRRVRYADATAWFARAKVEYIEFSEDKVSGVFSCACEATETLGISLSPIARRWLERQISLSAGLTAAYLRQLRTVKTLPSELWTGTSSHLWSRMLCYETLRRGGVVTAYDHGAGSGLFDEEWHSLNFQSVCSKFVALDKEQTAEISHNFKRFSLPNRDIPTVESFNEAHWIRPDVKSGGEGSRIPALPCRACHPGTVLFVPLPLVGEAMHATPYPDDLSALDFMIRVVQTLWKAGFQVTLRPHPEFPFVKREELGNVLEAGVENRRFEHALQDYDFLVFGYPTTSTLRAAVSSAKPLVLFNLGVESWNANARCSLEERSAVLEVSRERGGRLTAALDELPRALELAQEKALDGALQDVV